MKNDILAHVGEWLQTSEESRVENPQLEELQPDFEGKERNGENEANAEIGSQTSASSQPNEPLPTKGEFDASFCERKASSW